MKSTHVDLEGPVHYVDFGGDGPPLVCVHGLGGSALNWMAVAPAISAAYRVLAPDLRGFGRTPLGPGARLRDNEHLLELFLRHVAGWPATLIANSMGGLLSVRLAARRPDLVHSLVLVDPALPWRRYRGADRPLYALLTGLLTPGLGGAILRRRIRRAGPERIFKGALDLVCANPNRVPAEVVRAHVELEQEWIHWPRRQRALVQAARSLAWAYARASDSRTYQRVRAPALVVHGDRDRLVPVRSSLAIGPRYGWQVEVLPDVGHVPMMEAPGDFTRVTLGWLAAQAAAA